MKLAQRLNERRSWIRRMFTSLLFWTALIISKRRKKRRWGLQLLPLRHLLRRLSPLLLPQQLLRRLSPFLLIR